MCTFLSFSCPIHFTKSHLVHPHSCRMSNQARILDPTNSSTSGSKLLTGEERHELRSVGQSQQKRQKKMSSHASFHVRIFISFYIKFLFLTFLSPWRKEKDDAIETAGGLCSQSAGQVARPMLRCMKASIAQCTLEQLQRSRRRHWPHKCTNRRCSG